MGSNHKRAFLRVRVKWALKGGLPPRALKEEHFGGADGGGTGLEKEKERGNREKESANGREMNCAEKKNRVG